MEAKNPMQAPMRGQAYYMVGMFCFGVADEGSIGNEKSVGIWNNFQLLRNNAPQVLSSIIDSMADAEVEILIDETTRQ